MLGIVELLRLRGLPSGKRVKLVRHQDKRWDVTQLHIDGHLETYQSYQARPIFECDLIVSFLGLPRGRARFVGVYEVRKRRPAADVPLPEGFPYPEMYAVTNVWYELVRVQGFEDLEGRVVIRWGRGELAWHQWLREKEVVEILPEGYTRDFPGYLDFVLTYPELKRIVEYPEANRVWVQALSEVAGVYLIVEAAEGRQYVGSAAGQGGIMARWADYVRSGHGGNTRLRALVADDPRAVERFRFTVLRTLPKTLTRLEVIAFEQLYKEKLGSRAFGLNLN